MLRPNSHLNRILLQRFDATSQTLERANQRRSHPPMSVKWNLVSERARRIPVRVFEDTRAKFARNEICARGGTRSHNSSRCGGSATLRPDPTCWSLANFRRLKTLLEPLKHQNNLEITGCRKSLSHLGFLGPCNAFPLSLYLREKKSERIFG